MYSRLLRSIKTTFVQRSVSYGGWFVSPRIRVPSYSRVLARMRVCENNQREREKYADARIREREFARINRENTIKTRTRVCEMTRTRKRREYIARTWKRRERKNVNKARKREIKHESARYTAQLETLKRVFFYPSQIRKLKTKMDERRRHRILNMLTLMEFLLRCNNNAHAFIVRFSSNYL